MTLDKLTCYIVTANNVIGRDINERVPTYQAILDSESCNEKCAYITEIAERQYEVGPWDHF